MRILNEGNESTQKKNTLALLFALDDRGTVSTYAARRYVRIPYEDQTPHSSGSERGDMLLYDLLDLTLELWSNVTASNFLEKGGL